MKFFNLTLILLFSFCGITFGLNNHQDITLLSSDTSEISFEFTPNDIKYNIIDASEQRYVIPTIENCYSSYNEIGSPQIPFKYAIVALPLNYEVASISVSENNNYQEKLNYPIIPVPYIKNYSNKSDKKNIDNTQEIYEQNRSKYQLNSFIPSEIVKISEPYFLGNQWVVDVNLYPIKYNPSANILNISKSLKVNLKLQPNIKYQISSLKPQVSDELFEDVYNALIVNYEQAKNWRYKVQEPRCKIQDTRYKIQDTNPFYISKYSNWLKIRVNKSGIYKITYQDFINAGVDPNVDISNLLSIRIFNDGGLVIPESILSPRPTLKEIAIGTQGLNDGKFDDNDYIFFYGLGTSGWTSDYDTNAVDYQYYYNKYTDENAYWLTWDGNFPTQPKRITSRSVSSGNATTLSTFKEKARAEKNILQSFDSQDWWFWYKFAKTSSEIVNFPIDLYSVDNSSQASLSATFYSITTDYTINPDHHIVLFFNGLTNLFADTTWDGIRQFTALGTLQGSWLKDGTNNLSVKFPRDLVTSTKDYVDQAYLSHFEIEYQRKFIANQNILKWTIFESQGSGNYKYSISGFSDNNIKVFDITNIFDVVEITGGQRNNNTITFQDILQTGKKHKNYFALSSQGFSTPLSIEKTQIAGLGEPCNCADYIIITHDDFYNEVLPLKTLRETTLDTFANPRVFVAKISDIYNEFGFGRKDISAIRDFIKFANENWQRSPSYFVLVGDASIDFKGNVSSSKIDYIPTKIEYPCFDDSYSTDDWFADITGTSDPDVFIGRIAVQSRQETADAIQKIIDYETKPLFGLWKHNIIAIADDDYDGFSGSCNDPNYIMNNGSNQIWTSSEYFYFTLGNENIDNNKIKPYYDFDEIYLVTYRAEDKRCGWTCCGTSSKCCLPMAGKFPNVERMIVDKVNKGALIVHFAGHANPLVWAHENLLYFYSDFPLWQNKDKYPFVFVAGCDAGEFYDTGLDCMSENFVKVPNRGAIGFLSASGKVTAPHNRVYEEIFFQQLFLSKTMTIGKASFLAKKLLGGGTTSALEKQFVLFGDPGLLLAKPKLDVTISGIDTLKTGSITTIKGKVEGNRNFYGNAFVQIFDSMKDVIYLQGPNNKQESGAFGEPYDLPGNPIYKGTVPVKNDTFSVQFFVPLSSQLNLGNKAKINCYIYNNNIDGNGGLVKLPIIDADSLADTTMTNDVSGPIISVFNEKYQLLKPGDYISQGSTIFIQLEDTHGINTAGRNISDYIQVKIDNEPEPQIISERFIYDEGSYRKGKADYTIPTNIKEGSHTLTIKAKDNLGNQTTFSLPFSVTSSENLEIRNVYNYPNPFSHNGTYFIYELSLPSKVTIKIYTVSGKLIRVIKNAPGNTGYNQIYWDGRDVNKNELANGVYIYKISAENLTKKEAKQKSAIGKAILMR